VSDRIGRFEAATGGTIFLDEVGEMSPYIQIKLLRVLQEKEINRVGENENRKIDVRIIAATNQNLFEAVHSGTFREDLYYRLKVFPIHLPPLRQRKKDIPLLINHFIEIKNINSGKRIQDVSTETMRFLLDYAWPGNVRELENTIEHAFVLCTRASIEPNDIPIEIRHPTCYSSTIATYEKSAYPRRKKPTKAQLVERLTAMDWNKTDVARYFGLSRTSIWKYMKKHGIPLKPPIDQ
jgi:transcriptional regulator with PAS, ATPase and Fis domain